MTADEFDRRTFEELVLYIAERTADDRDFGRVKLAKTLFYADFEAYRLHGKAITGASYRAWKYGPYPPALKSAVNRLKNENRIDEVPAPADHDTERLVPRTGRRPAERERFTEWLPLIDEWISRIQQETATSLKKHVHEHFAWKLTREHGLAEGRVNDEIPYTASVLPAGPPSKERVERARRVAREQGWLTEDGFVWEREPT